MTRRVGFTSRDDAAETGPRKIRRVPVFFLSVWLILWTGGIFYVAGALLGGMGTMASVASGMMILWLVIAVIGWLFGIRILRRLLKGAPIGAGTNPPHPHPSRHDHDDR